MSDPNMPQPRPHWTGTAIALVVIGLVILVPSGLCTAMMGGMTIFSMIMEPSNTANEDAMSFLTSAVLFGGPFIAAGAFLIYGGFRARKRK